MENTFSPEENNQQYYRYDQIAEKLHGLDAVDEEQIIKYRNQGYLAVEEVLTLEEVKKSIDALLELINTRSRGARIELYMKTWDELKTDEERELAVRKVSNFVENDEWLKGIANHPGIMAKLELILGEKPKLAQAIALLKPPGGLDIPWHQDMSVGGLAYDKTVIGVWIALDEAELENGCMHVIPGSHAGGAIPHYALRSWQLCGRDIPVEEDVAVTLKPGGLMLFHGLIKHGTPHNLSAKRRRALQFHYVGISAKKLVPAEYKRMFTNDMTSAEC
ncbi:phytanoyl-CoA dioxygenase family protein [Paenibacillus psychroresistens]|uniref:Phytanoyl-CoA dioxygenase family protein n=1 Tax=Paenibacillus psychroresistens TaxID=1778678 RepID=A0A6B8RCZ1_9BACL|nr:phytanoyl-CoA dioxygenase family protein [Paenibacillus psychroresistens]QGQ94331.1 phytanoyl-CoA dioxygenase family protein [Paenibacillus psychroresistens]